MGPADTLPCGRLQDLAFCPCVDGKKCHVLTPALLASGLPKTTPTISCNDRAATALPTTPVQSPSHAHSQPQLTPPSSLPPPPPPHYGFSLHSQGRAWSTGDSSQHCPPGHPAVGVGGSERVGERGGRETYPCSKCRALPHHPCCPAINT